MKKLLMILVLIGIVFGGIGCLTKEGVEKFEITKMTDFANDNDIEQIVINESVYDIVNENGKVSNYVWGVESNGEFVANLCGSTKLYKIHDDENNVTIYYTNGNGLCAVRD